MTKSKVCLVIGAGDATGGAVAKRFAREGYVVCVTRRTLEKLQPLLETIHQSGGLAHGFAQQNEDGAVVTTLATHEYALYEVGEHNDDGQYWVLFRDLVDIEIPEGGEAFIVWSSNQTALNEDGVETSVPRPVSNQDVPNVWWA